MLIFFKFGGHFGFFKTLNDERFTLYWEHLPGPYGQIIKTEKTISGKRNLGPGSAGLT